MPFVWFAIAGLILFVTFAALWAIVSPPGIVGEQKKIHNALSNAESDWGLLPAGPSAESKREIISRLESVDLQTDTARGTMARAVLVLKQSADPNRVPSFRGLSDYLGDSHDALTPKAESAKDIAETNDALRELYTAETLSPPDAERLAKQLSDNGARWPMDLAAMRAAELSGESSQLSEREGVVVTAFLVLLSLGVVCLAAIAFKPKPLGIPVHGTRGTGDALGLRFLLFLGSFLFAGVVIATFAMLGTGVIDDGYTLLLTEVVLIAVVLVLLKLPIGGRSFSLRDIGLRSENFGKDCLYGFMGYLANIPVVVLLAAFGMFFLRWIPSGGHPIESELLDLNNLPLLILTAGPLTAILEELTFRGMLFQGLALRLRVWSAITLSSLAFAMIHPQGGALWLALAWVGGMAAYLTYQRKSLVPAIVMHTCHNTTLILLAAYASGAS
ncbi:MAG: CPBP family intramembrane metalloprotease [Armatimonadota bacterium]|nr:CPBP family intramembrane metalloprotease [Armatimonadota bacterium]